MLRITLTALLAAAPAVVWGTYTEFVVEDFEGSEFPPPNWFSNGSWSRASEGTNHYAHASDYLGSSRLLTSKFELSQGTGINIEFEYKAGWSATGNHYVAVLLYYGTYSSPRSVWSRNMQATSTWTLYRAMNVLVSETRNDYFCGWMIAANYASTWFDVDDIKVTLNNTAVSPTSLGRVRALYR